MLLKIESFEFAGAPSSFEDENGDTIIIAHTMRGYVCRVASKPQPHVVPVALGDTIITKPFFKVVSKLIWKKIQESTNGTD